MPLDHDERNTFVRHSTAWACRSWWGVNLSRRSLFRNAIVAQLMGELARADAERHRYVRGSQWPRSACPRCPASEPTEHAIGSIGVERGATLEAVRSPRGI